MVIPSLVIPTNLGTFFLYSLDGDFHGISLVAEVVMTTILAVGMTGMTGPKIVWW